MPGDGSDERLRGAGAHSHLSPGPPLRGTLSCFLGNFIRRAKLAWLVLLAPAHWALPGLKFENPALYGRRLPWHSCGSQALCPGEGPFYPVYFCSPTGAEGKRSFPGSSLPSFLSRKRSRPTGHKVPSGGYSKAAGRRAGEVRQWGRGHGLERVWQPGGAPGGRPPSLSACHPMRRVPVRSRQSLKVRNCHGQDRPLDSLG